MMRVYFKGLRLLGFYLLGFVVLFRGFNIQEKQIGRFVLLHGEEERHLLVHSLQPQVGFRV